MWTKLEAAKLAAETGIPTVISSLSQPQLFLRVVNGESVGTRIAAATAKREGRKRWLLTEPSSGVVYIDEGAFSILRTKGASLLPVGVCRVEGYFKRGAVVEVLCPDGKACARGVVSYGSEEIEKIQGCKTSEIVGQLGYSRGNEIMHRDNLVLLEEV